MTRTCLDCPSPISRCSQGRCRSCATARLHNDPAIVARRHAGIRAAAAKPGANDARRASVARYCANMPEAERERRRANGRRLAREVLLSPEVMAKAACADARARAGRTKTETVLGWCPPPLRDAYRHLLKKGYLAADARRMIEAEIPETAAHTKRVLANHRDAQRIRAERDQASAY